MKRVAVIGAGNMGSAIIKRIRKRYKIIVSDIDQNRFREINVSNNRKAVKDADIIILAIKPQDMDTVLEEIKDVVMPSQLIISIAAGVKTRKIENRLGKIPVVRVMPNTPLLVGMGIGGICKGRYANSNHLSEVKNIFPGFILVEKESLMDAVTAISGSGPAYVYLFIEALINSAVGLGLSISDAKVLVYKTIEGAMGLLEKTAKEPIELRRQVTSPGGTTESALKVFQKKGFCEIIEEAVNSACRRSKQLSR